MNGFFREASAKAKELSAGGLERDQALEIAALEERIIREWPGSQNDLSVLMHGDFEPPTSALEFPSLGITVQPENIRSDKNVAQGALTVLKATVKVDEKSVSGVIDAASRINILLGNYTLHSWGNGASGWWSWVTHGNTFGGGTTFAHPEMEASIAAILKLPIEVRKRVEAALDIEEHAHGTGLNPVFAPRGGDVRYPRHLVGPTSSAHSVHRHAPAATRQVWRAGPGCRGVRLVE